MVSVSYLLHIVFPLYQRGKHEINSAFLSLEPPAEAFGTGLSLSMSLKIYQEFKRETKV